MPLQHSLIGDVYSLLRPCNAGAVITGMSCLRVPHSNCANSVRASVYRNYEHCQKYMDTVIAFY